MTKFKTYKFSKINDKRKKNLGRNGSTLDMKTAPD